MWYCNIQEKGLSGHHTKSSTRAGVIPLSGAPSPPIHTARARKFWDGPGNGVLFESSSELGFSILRSNLSDIKGSCFLNTTGTCAFVIADLGKFTWNRATWSSGRRFHSVLVKIPPVRKLSVCSSTSLSVPLATNASKDRKSVV